MIDNNIKNEINWFIFKKAIWKIKNKEKIESYIDCFCFKNIYNKKNYLSLKQKVIKIQTIKKINKMYKNE